MNDKYEVMISDFSRTVALSFFGIDEIAAFLLNWSWKLSVADMLYEFVILFWVVTVCEIAGNESDYEIFVELLILNWQIVVLMKIEEFCCKFDIVRSKCNGSNLL